jgi:hypothetical protein
MRKSDCAIVSVNWVNSLLMGGFAQCSRMLVAVSLTSHAQGTAIDARRLLQKILALADTGFLSNKPALGIRFVIDHSLATETL